jgi:hypothetical protein
MSFKKLTTSAAVIASLVAANLGPVATAANAHDGWRGGGYDRGYSRHYDGPRDYYGPRHRYSYKAYKRDKRDRNIAKGLAIGLGVLAVGAILSNSHR